MALVTGIDVSKWQGEMSWLTAQSAGAKFAIIRAGSVDNNTGACYEDYQFKRNSALAPATMAATGYYWYFRPNHNPLTQADYFCNLIKPLKTWKIYPVCDTEVNGGKTPLYVSNALMKFCNRIYEILRVHPMIYTSPGFWDANVAPNAWAQYLKVWIAHWGVKVPTLAREWKEWKFWQTHVAQDGYAYGTEPPNQGLDHDVYNGTWDQFANEFCGGISTVPVDIFTVDYVYPYMVAHGYTGPKPEGAK